MFSNFGGVKKREPLFTFKRKTLFPSIEETNRRPFQQPQRQIYNDLLIPTFEELSTQIKKPTTTTTTTTTTTVPVIIKTSTSSSSTNSTITSTDLSDSAPIVTKPLSIEATHNDDNDTEPSKLEDDSIFDFPDSTEEFSEIKVMVASTRTVPEAPKLKRKKSKTSKSRNKSPSKSILAKQVPIVPTSPDSSLKNKTTPQIDSFSQSQNTFDIFDFDPNPTAHLSLHTFNTVPLNTAIQNHTTYVNMNNMNNFYNFNTISQPMMNNSYNIYEPSLITNITNYTNNNNNNNYNNNHTHISINSMLNNPVQIDTVNTSMQYMNPVQIDTVNTTVNTTMQSIKQVQINSVNTPLKSMNPLHPPPAEKKRKRNLVAHLKSASGETETKPKNTGFDFLSDEEELILEQQENQLLPLREIITNKERSLSPELSYAERMELELEAVMKSEFGGNENKKESEQKNNEKRPRYQPLNKMNVKVTFQKNAQ